MTPLSHRALSRSRPLAVLASAALTLVVLGAIVPARAQTPDPAETAWDGSHWSSPRNGGQTVSDGVFSGTFVHQGTEPQIASVDLGFEFAGVHEPTCELPPAPPTQNGSTTTITSPDPPPTSTPTTPTDPSPTSAPTNSTMDFLFEVGFPCNGVYNVTATASLDSPVEDTHAITLLSINIAVPPQPPLNFFATDNGNRTVTLTWTAPNDAPPDLAGFRISRMEKGIAAFELLGTTPPATFTFTDASIPAAGGSYFYAIETLRKAPNPRNAPLASLPITTGQALVVNGSGQSVAGGSPGGGGSAGGGGSGSRGGGGSGANSSDRGTLVDEAEPGVGELPIPGAGAIQRFAGRDGAGLLKPFAAALDIAVWAGLILFLTRRAARQAREDALFVELEDPL